MVWIPRGIYDMGAANGDRMALPHEKPKHTVKVGGFYMDETEVTNTEFSKFIEATNYITPAERPVVSSIIIMQYRLFKIKKTWQKINQKPIGKKTLDTFLSY